MKRSSIVVLSLFGVMVLAVLFLFAVLKSLDNSGEFLTIFKNLNSLNLLKTLNIWKKIAYKIFNVFYIFKIYKND